ncbi:ubiquitin carboxyl-terminal hydrolase 10-like [Limulus polyphemus]|uniref:ubiquitinyl hydrolase 1 n=1 Tax=Limulus polyphemus TaxID=6850 RepID=A0ABM1C5T8_LIMPO|nr:ubiquitin carboxyl-terminal hydrolase 10-like [Limulus polyphemus]
MNNIKLDLEFLDLSDVPENEVEEINFLLHPPGGVKYIELPWDAPANFLPLVDNRTTNNIISEQTQNAIENSNHSPRLNPCEAPRFHHQTGSPANHPVVPPPFISPSGPTSVPHLVASQAFPFIPCSYTLLPSHFQQLNSPVFTSSFDQQEVSLVQRTTLPPAFPTHTTSRDCNSAQPAKPNKTLNPPINEHIAGEKQSNQHKESVDYYSSVNKSKEQQSNPQGSVFEDSLPTGCSSLVPVPFTVSASSFPSSTDTICMTETASGYPPGMSPVHYQHQRPSPPILYPVPFIPPAYPRFIHTQSSQVVSGYFNRGKGETNSNDSGARITSVVPCIDGGIQELHVTPTCSSSNTRSVEIDLFNQQDQLSKDSNMFKSHINTLHIVQPENQNSQNIPTIKTFTRKESNCNNCVKTDQGLLSCNGHEFDKLLPADETVNSSAIKDSDRCTVVLEQTLANNVSLADSENSPFLTGKKPDVSFTTSDFLVTDTHPKTSVGIENELGELYDAISAAPSGVTKVTSDNVWQRRSGADLFKNQSVCPATVLEIEKERLPSVSPKTTPIKHEKKDPETMENSKIVNAEDDVLAYKLAKIFESTHLNHSIAFLQPRGLTNRSNWCYVNATLQALLVCPPLYNLLKQLTSVSGQNREKSSTPILDSLMEFVQEFPIIPQGNRNKRKEDLVIGLSFEPVNIYKMLNVIRSECVKGHQEDAEEFLSCILNGLHEEMLAVLQIIRKDEVKNTGNEEMPTNGHLEEDKDEGWQVMGPKKKSILTRSAKFSRSPISDIFGGQIRSVLTTGNESSAFLQPFFTLQLDIQSERVVSVLSALNHLTSKELVQGYTSAKTKQEVEASRRITIEELPLVLVLHFKRFVYDKNGGSKKVVKCTEYSVTLELSRDLLSQEVRSKYSQKSLRSYKLFAVVYHEGKEAVKGHYITDVYHAGSGGWLRCDDFTITPITEKQLLRYNPPRVPYLLFYRRLDTVQPGITTK